MCCFFFSSRRRHTRWTGDWSSDVCSSDLNLRKRRRIGSFAFGEQLRSGLLIAGEEFALLIEKLCEHSYFVLARTARSDQTERPNDSRFNRRTAFLEHALADEARGF